MAHGSFTPLSPLVIDMQQWWQKWPPRWPTRRDLYEQGQHIGHDIAAVAVSITDLRKQINALEDELLKPTIIFEVGTPKDKEL